MLLHRVCFGFLFFCYLTVALKAADEVVIPSLNLQHAETQVMPADVYANVWQVIHQLHQLHRADGTFEKLSCPVPAPDNKTLKLAEKHPRHVFDKALRILSSVHQLKSLNNLPVTTAYNRTDHVTEPMHVKALITHIADEMPVLLQHYGVGFISPANEDVPVFEIDTIEPRHVYSALSAVDCIIQFADLPPHSPKDVYRLVEMLDGELSLLTEIMNLQAPEPETFVENKRPADVFALVLKINHHLLAMQTSNVFSLKYPILPITPPSAETQPSHVLDAVGQTLADVMIIKRALNVTTSQTPIVIKPGKTPSDVFARLQSVASRFPEAQ